MAIFLLSMVIASVLIGLLAFWIGIDPNSDEGVHQFAWLIMVLIGGALWFGIATLLDKVDPFRGFRNWANKTDWYTVAGTGVVYLAVFAFFLVLIPFLLVTFAQ